MTNLLDSTSTSSAGTSGSFPSTDTSSQGTSSASVLSLTPSQFAADYNVSSSELPTYIDLQTGKLNANAEYLAWYFGLTQAERQTVQSSMVETGALSASEATGENNSASASAFKSLIGQTSAQGSNVVAWLNQNATGTSGIQNQISLGLESAQKAASTPIVATVENPTTLSATLTQAFEQALGYSPSAAQIQSFIKQVQNQDTAYASAPRTEAQDEINQAHSEESALNKLGPDGIDTVIAAYQAAVTGTKLPGAGTVQGPATGSIPTSPPQTPGSQGATIQANEAATAAPAGTRLPAGVAEYNTPQGTQVGANLLPTPDGTITTRTPNNPGILNDIESVVTGQGQINAGYTTTRQTKYQQRYTTAPGAPSGATTTTYGGLYALSAADWKEVQTLYPLAKKYATPGAAPQSVQQAAFTSLLSNAYESNGNSWSKAIASIASGTPFGTKEGTNLSTFGNQVAAEVNNQITALQSQVDNSDVTVKVSAPDATAEANLAAKQSDPASYEAAQTASWGEELNKMLTGTPSMYNQTSSDTFTGPVSPEAATAAPVGGSTGNL